MDDKATTTESTVDEILSDILRITRQKVDPDDPVVVAALVQSKLLKQTGKSISHQLEASVATSTKALMDQLRKERMLSPLSRRKFPTFAVVLLSIFIGIMCGLSISRATKTREEEGIEAAGKDFLLIIPRLDKETRGRIEREIEKVKREIEKPRGAL